MNVRRLATDAGVVAILAAATAIYLRTPYGWGWFSGAGPKEVLKLGGQAVLDAELAKWWISSAIGMAAMLVRSRLPLLALACTAAMSVVHVTSLITGFVPLDLAAPIALYTVASARNRDWVSWIALAATLAASITPVLWFDFTPAMSWGAGMLFPPIAVVAAWLLGNWARDRRIAAAEQVRILEQQRDRQGEIATAAERARLARELHDVVAHGLSIIVIQAQAAAGAIEKRPVIARAAVDAIENTGRESLAEMRRLLGLDRPGEAELAPVPDATAITTLAERVRAAGLPVDVSVTGDLTTLPSGISLSIYRLTQEALTNTLKHAGPQATAHITIQCGTREVQLIVRDTGTGGTPDEANGSGIHGMRERVTMLGGTFTAQPAEAGGFQVQANIPLETTS